MARIACFLVVAILFVSVKLPAHGAGHRGSTKRALYFLDNNEAGASVISLKIAEDDGTLSSPTRIPTGGKGQLGLALPLFERGPPTLAGFDSLFGQDSIIVEGNYLFVVNAGSNTLSMFLINKDDPWHPTLVGEPADTLGDFPMSVAYSSKLKRACVLNGGKRSGVTCFSVTKHSGLTAIERHPRSISAGLNQTTPPVGIGYTTSDIVFNPSSTALFVLIKGNSFPLYPTGPGYIYVWPILDGEVSFTPASFTVLETVPVPFSGLFAGNDDSRLFVSDASFGPAIIGVSPAPSFTVTVEKRLPISYNLANCWTAYQPILDTVYFVDTFRPNITVVDAKREVVDGTIDFETPGPPGVNFTAALDNRYGGFDTRIQRRYMYLLGGVPEVIVIDTLTKTQIQKIDLSELGPRESWTGMAVYPKN